MLPLRVQRHVARRQGQVLAGRIGRARAVGCRVPALEAVARLGKAVFPDLHFRAGLSCLGGDRARSGRVAAIADGDDLLHGLPLGIQGRLRAGQHDALSRLVAVPRAVCPGVPAGEGVAVARIDVRGDLLHRVQVAFLVCHAPGHIRRVGAIGKLRLLGRRLLLPFGVQGLVRGAHRVRVARAVLRARAGGVFVPARESVVVACGHRRRDGHTGVGAAVHVARVRLHRVARVLVQREAHLVRRLCLLGPYGIEGLGLVRGEGHVPGRVGLAGAALVRVPLLEGVAVALVAVVRQRQHRHARGGRRHLDDLRRAARPAVGVEGIGGRPLRVELRVGRYLVGGAGRVVRARSACLRVPLREVGAVLDEGVLRDDDLAALGARAGHDRARVLPVAVVGQLEDGHSLPARVKDRVRVHRVARARLQRAARAVRGRVPLLEAVARGGDIGIGGQRDLRALLHALRDRGRRRADAAPVGVVGDVHLLRRRLVLLPLGIEHELCLPLGKDIGRLVGVCRAGVVRTRVLHRVPSGEIIAVAGEAVGRQDQRARARRALVDARVVVRPVAHEMHGKSRVLVGVFDLLPLRVQGQAACRHGDGLAGRIGRAAACRAALSRVPAVEDIAVVGRRQAVAAGQDDVFAHHGRLRGRRVGTRVRVVGDGRRLARVFPLGGQGLRARLQGEDVTGHPGAAALAFPVVEHLACWRRAGGRRDDDLVAFLARVAQGRGACARHLVDERGICLGSLGPDGVQARVLGAHGKGVAGLVGLVPRSVRLRVPAFEDIALACGDGVFRNGEIAVGPPGQIVGHPRDRRVDAALVEVQGDLLGLVELPDGVQRRRAGRQRDPLAVRIGRARAVGGRVPFLELVSHEGKAVGRQQDRRPGLSLHLVHRARRVLVVLVEDEDAVRIRIPYGIERVGRRLQDVDIACPVGRAHAVLCRVPLLEHMAVPCIVDRVRVRRGARTHRDLVRARRGALVARVPGRPVRVVDELAAGDPRAPLRIQGRVARDVYRLRLVVGVVGGARPVRVFRPLHEAVARAGKAACLCGHGPVFHQGVLGLAGNRRPLRRVGVVDDLGDGDLLRYGVELLGLLGDGDAVACLVGRARAVGCRVPVEKLHPRRRIHLDLRKRDRGAHVPGEGVGLLVCLV